MSDKAGDALKRAENAAEKRYKRITNARANKLAADERPYGGDLTTAELLAERDRLRAESSIAREALGGAA